MMYTCGVGGGDWGIMVAGYGGMGRNGDAEGGYLFGETQTIVYSLVGMIMIIWTFLCNKSVKLVGVM